MRIAGWVLAAASVLASPARAQETAPAAPPPNDPVQRFTLDNGLRVALRPLEAATSVAVVVLFDFGEDADPAGRSGLAHLCEHLYCTAATASAPARTADAFFAAHPLGSNAQTGWDTTVFAAVVGPEALDAELSDAAGRLKGLRVTPADLERERPRVLAELANMYGRMPRLAATNLTREALVRDEAARRTARRGGVDAAVVSLTFDDVKAALDAHYRAGNARLVLAGKFDGAATAKRVRELFADAPRGAPAVRAAPPRQARREGETSPTVAVHRPAGALERGAVACLAWLGPRPGEEGYAAFTVLSTRLMYRTSGLGGRDPSRPQAVLLPLDDPGPAFLAGSVLDGETPEAAVARLRKVADGILDLDVADGQWAAAFLGPFLDTHVPPDSRFEEAFRRMQDAQLAQNVYGAAFGIGRRDQLGIDGAALAKEMAALTADDLRAARRRWFGSPVAAVVVPSE